MEKGCLPGGRHLVRALGVFLVSVALSLSSYAQDTDVSLIKGAKDSTHVKFIVCISGIPNVNAGCKITSRFDTIESCRRHETFYMANCDRVSKPGWILCKDDQNFDLDGITTYCIPD